MEPWIDVSLDDEFNQKYPPDPLGDEMSPDARIWKLYADHAKSCDLARIAAWDKALDVVLFSVGLSSKIVEARD